MNKSTYRYVPLIKNEDKFEVLESMDVYNPWADSSYVESFEKLLGKYFDKIKGTVIINGASFKNCTLFKPKENFEDFFYIKVDADNLPFNPESEFSEIETEVDENGIAKIQRDLSKSEEYYEHHYTNLDNSYLYPFLSDSDNNEFQYLDENQFLKFPRVIIVGQAGAGKTTLVRKLAYELSKKASSGSSVLPIYLRLRDISTPKTELLNALEANYNLLNKKHILEKKNKGRIIYVFDGVDELNQENKEQFLDWLDYMEQYDDKLRIILTSRNNHFIRTEKFHTYKKFYLKPLYDNQIYQISHRFLGDEKSTNKFVGYFRNNRELLDVLSNPFSLTVSLALYAFKSVLPINLTDLIKELAFLFTEGWDANRNINRDKNLNSSTTRLILGKLAFQLKIQKQDTFRTIFCKEIFPNNSVDEYFDFLTEIKDNTSLLSYKDERWSFQHRYFLDFFCANYLIDKAGGIDSVYDKFKDAMDWINVWNNSVQLSSDPEYYFGGNEIRPVLSFSEFGRVVSTLMSDKSTIIFDSERLNSNLIANLKELNRNINNTKSNDSVKLWFKPSYEIELNEFANLLKQLIYLYENENSLVFQFVVKNRNLKLSKLIIALSNAGDSYELVIQKNKIIYTIPDPL